MKVVIAPDSFKESLSALEVARAIADGVREVEGDAVVDLCPMADGGEGTLDAMVAATGGMFRTAVVLGPLGESREARFGLIDDGATAVIEIAEAAGLGLVRREERDPLRASTFGVGQLIRAALDGGSEGPGRPGGVDRMIVGIGGSATTDGGAGCAQALGVVFFDAAGRVCADGLAGGDLRDIRRVDLGARHPRVGRCEILVACDVTNPLTGPDGAAAVYGPQKGATPPMVHALDRNLAHLAAVVREHVGVDVEDLPGAGAAGGLGAGLVAFAGARLCSGVEIVADAVGLADRVRGADLVITGEGRFDAQSASGKTAAGVARVADEAGVPCICIPGHHAADAPRGVFRMVRPLVADDVTHERALADPAGLLRRRTAEVLRTLVGRTIGDDASAGRPT